jgi:hypothetical protein
LGQSDNAGRPAIRVVDVKDHFDRNTRPLDLNVTVRFVNRYTLVATRTKVIPGCQTKQANTKK